MFLYLGRFPLELKLLVEFLELYFFNFVDRFSVVKLVSRTFFVPRGCRGEQLIFPKLQSSFMFI